MRLIRNTIGISKPILILFLLLISFIIGALVLRIIKPRVILATSEIKFNPAVSVNHFNITVENSQSSTTYVNITSISVNVANITPRMVTPSLPYGLAPGDPPAMFKVLWNWTDYQGESVTVGAHTLQGYAYLRTLTLPPPVNLTINAIDFQAYIHSWSTHVTVTNAESSPTHVDITEIAVSIDNEPPFKLTPSGGAIYANLPSKLEQNSSITFLCYWDWINYRHQNAKFKVFTRQGFVASKSATIP